MSKKSDPDLADAGDSGHNRLFEVFEQTPAAIAVVKGKGHVFEFVNPLYLKLSGKANNIVGLTVREAFPELDGQGFFRLLDTVYRTGEPFVGNEMPVDFKKNGNNESTKSYFNFVYQPLKNSKGEVNGIMAHAVDVTEQVLARQVIKDSAKAVDEAVDEARNFFNLSDLLLCIAGTDGYFRRLNPAWRKMLGYSLKELTSEPWLHYVHPDDIKSTKREAAKLAQGASTIRFQNRYRCKDGSYKWIIWNVQPVGDVLYASAQDITAIKEAESELRASEARLRFMAESMPQKIFTAKADGNVDYFNPQWMEYTGLQFEEIINWGWQQFIHPDDVEENVRLWLHSIETGKAFQFEHRFRNKDGQYRWHFSRAHALRDSQGKIIMWIGSNTDIEDMKQANARKAELEITTTTLKKQSAELVALNEAKDEFISLASHQLRTPASAAKQFLGMVLEGYAGELTPQQRELLEQARESNERQIATVNDLLRIAQIDAGKIRLNKKPINLVSLIDSVIVEQSGTFQRRRQEIVFTHKQDKVTCKIDKERMRMVLGNLIDNASKYTHAHKKIEVIVSKLKNKVFIVIKDQGVGIKQADLDKLFHKFSRVDNSLSVLVGGTGLGLYWVKKIIDLHEGTIVVKSVPRKGTEFIITLSV